MKSFHVGGSVHLSQSLTVLPCFSGALPSDLQVKKALFSLTWTGPAIANPEIGRRQPILNTYIHIYSFWPDGAPAGPLFTFFYLSIFPSLSPPPLFTHLSAQVLRSETLDSQNLAVGIPNSYDVRCSERALRREAGGRRQAGKEKRRQDKI